MAGADTFISVLVLIIAALVLATIVLWIRLLLEKLRLYLLKKMLEELRSVWSDHPSSETKRREQGGGHNILWPIAIGIVVWLMIIILVA